MTNCYQKWMHSKAINNIFIALDNNARFVGGAVRDAILGKPAKDIDIATPILPQEVMQRLQEHRIHAIPTGITFGTVTAVIDGAHYEITTLRSDIDCSGRHAIVSFTDNWQQDAMRRDFTINAMYCNRDGEVFDYYSGLHDLQSRHLRFVGEATQRCREDYLRILRFFRFFAHYGHQVDMEALIACKELACGLENISGERIAVEMFKLLTAENPIYALQLMVQTNVVQYIMPGVTNSNIVFLEKLLDLPNRNKNDALLNLTVLLGKNPDIANFVSSRWRLANKDKKRLEFLCNPVNKIPLPNDIKLAKKLIRSWGINNFLALCHMGFAYGMDAAWFNQLVALENWPAPEFPLKGSDLVARGIKPGKKLGKMLRAAENWWEENDYRPDKGEIMEKLADFNL